MTDSPFEALSRIEKEAQRALEGIASGSIPKGSSALNNIKYAAQDALHEAHQNGQVDLDAESVKTP